MIDWEQVKQLHDEVGGDGFDEVVDLFLEEVEAVISRIAGTTDATALSGDLHFLKGSALSLGFRQFSDLCHDGEAAAANGAASSVDTGRIVESYEASKQAFLAEYRQKIAA